VIIFLIFLGRFPECRSSIQQEVLEVHSNHAQDLLQRLLQNDPKRRITAADAMQHPWIRESNRAVGDSQQQRHDTQKARQSFLEFYQSDTLHKAALTAVASQITGDQIDVLREQFCLADKDGNGIITRDELIDFFGATSPGHIDEIETLFEDLDSDGSGAIEFTEWAAATLTSLTKVSDAALRAAFRALDVDNKGSISLNHLSRLIKLSHAELECILAHADTNDDEVIDFEEFKALLAKVAQRMTPTSSPDSPHMVSFFPIQGNQVLTDTALSGNMST